MSEFLEALQRDLQTDPYYGQNYANDGERFVAWYLRRLLGRTAVEARQEVTDGANDHQIDALVVDDDNRRILVVQGKFLTASEVDSGPLQEVLSSWVKLQDPVVLQQNCNDRLKERLESFRKAIEDEYEVTFELLTTGQVTSRAKVDLEAFRNKLVDDTEFPASFTLVDQQVLEERLAEADARELPSLKATVSLNPDKTLTTDLNGVRAVLTVLPLTECLNLPGIVDGRLFRKNVRQSLGSTNKVNRGLRQTLSGDRSRDFFFYHNGITALCRKFSLSEDKTSLTVEDMAVVNGCQSLTTIYSASERVRQLGAPGPHILFRFYEIPQRELADRISIYTNSQSAVKPRDLRSNDRAMLGLKRAYELRFPDGFLITQRGAARPADRDEARTVDVSEMAKALMAWQCQRPNISYNEKKLFDDYYKVLFRADYDPVSILALHAWMVAIDGAWPNLALNDVLKASRSYSKFHVLYAVSSLIAYASGQGDKVPVPAATNGIVEQWAGDVLPLAVNCLNKALESANQQAQIAGKVFSPPNWMKSLASIQGENLVASTIVGMLPGIGGQATLEKLRIPSDHFGLRWSAD